jgi:excisionase family DNA binding protein
MNTKWFTPEEIAEVLKINKLTVYKYIKSGRFKAIKLGRHYRISEKDLDWFVRKSIVDRFVIEDVLPKRDYEAVQEVKKRLLEKYSNKIELIKVFGSKVRGEATKESDLDLLIVVKDLDYPLEKKVRRTAHSVNDDFDYEPLISTIIMSSSDYENLKKLDTPFYNNVEKEGIDLWKAA